jgi:hypothetical protein
VLISTKKKSDEKAKKKQKTGLTKKVIICSPSGVYHWGCKSSDEGGIFWRGYGF